MINGEFRFLNARSVADECGHHALSCENMSDEFALENATPGFVYGYWYEVAKSFGEYRVMRNAKSVRMYGGERRLCVDKSIEARYGSFDEFLKSGWGRAIAYDYEVFMGSHGGVSKAPDCAEVEPLLVAYMQPRARMLDGTVENLAGPVKLKVYVDGIEDTMTVCMSGDGRMDAVWDGTSQEFYRLLKGDEARDDVDFDKVVEDVEKG